MNEYHITPNVGPNDDYQKALQDCIKAFESVQKLNFQQKQDLFNYLLQYNSFKMFMDRYSNNNF